jgi:outer membrane protein OmpA-like peptidoglycan-associated protein
MFYKMSLLAFAACLPAAALAQAAPDGGEKSADQIACELDGSCAATNAEAPAKKPVTRGFSWGSRATAATAPASPAQTSRATNYSTPRKSPVATKAPTAKSSRLGISFASGSAELTSTGRRQADSLHQALTKSGLSGKRYMIAGHTDASGSRDLNLELSRRRAQALVDYLVDKGIPRDHFRARGYGFDRPIDGTMASAAVNRRVEVTKLD